MALQGDVAGGDWMNLRCRQIPAEGRGAFRVEDLVVGAPMAGNGTWPVRKYS